MDRVDSTQKVFDDLRRRVAALPRLRHKAMQEELSDVTTIINQIEKAFLTHLVADSNENDIKGIVNKTIDKFGVTKAVALKQVKAIRIRLNRDYSINISEEALLARIKNHYNNES